MRNTVRIKKYRFGGGVKADGLSILLFTPPTSVYFFILVSSHATLTCNTF